MFQFVMTAPSDAQQASNCDAEEAEHPGTILRLNSSVRPSNLMFKLCIQKLIYTHRSRWTHLLSSESLAHGRTPQK